MVGLGAVAATVRRKGHDGEIDRFALESGGSEDARLIPAVIDTAIALGVLGEKDDGAVVYDRQDENETVWGDVLTDDKEWDMAAINDAYANRTDGGGSDV